MELRCPHCGKILNLSIEELAASGKMVVCPQCLGEFVAHGVEVAARRAAPKKPDPSPKPAGAQAVFCHNCGRQLPVRGLNYCPFCGSSLHFSQPKPSEEDAPTPKKEEEQRPQARPASPAAEKPLATTLQYLPNFMGRELREEPAGPLTKFICSIIILILIAIFIFIVWEGIK